jgi:hypothetical protein
MLHTIHIEEEHPILSPALPNPHQNEVPPTPGMERMRHPHNSISTVGTRRS